MTAVGAGGKTAISALLKQTFHTIKYTTHLQPLQAPLAPTHTPAPRATMTNPQTARLEELIDSDDTSMEHMHKIAEQARRANLWHNLDGESCLPGERSEDEEGEDDAESIIDGDGDEPTQDQLQAAANSCVKDCFPYECKCLANQRVIVQLPEGASVSKTLAAIRDAGDRCKMSPNEYDQMVTRRRETVEYNKEIDELKKKKKNQVRESTGGKRKRPKTDAGSVGRQPSPSLSIHK